MKHRKITMENKKRIKEMQNKIKHYKKRKWKQPIPITRMKHELKQDKKTKNKNKNETQK